MKTDRIDARNIGGFAGWLVSSGSRQELSNPPAPRALAQPRDARQVQGHVGQSSTTF